MHKFTRKRIDFDIKYKYNTVILIKISAASHEKIF